MTLPEKVRDVTQSEWLEVRERLAAAEAQAERWRQDAGAARGRYSGALSALKRAEDVAEDARQVAEQVESRLALAMAWGAEVCARFDSLRLADDAIISGLHGDLRSIQDIVSPGIRRMVPGDELIASCKHHVERAERAEAERDALLVIVSELRQTAFGLRVEVAGVREGLESCREDLARAQHRASLAALARDDARDERDQARSETDDARRACNLARDERDEARQRAERAEAERDALLARLGSPDTHPGIAWQSLNRERDEARERAQEAERDEARAWKDECGRWEERVGEVEARLLAVTAERDEARACWHRDVAKGRAAIEKREADLAAARAQLAVVEAAAANINRCIYYSDTYQQWVLAFPDRTRPALDALRSALADPAQAAREHDERVRAEERERHESKVAEWQAIAGNATEAANAAWKPFAEMALALGYKRAASPDFGEVDLVPLREHLATMQIMAALAERCKAAVVTLRRVVERAACQTDRASCERCAENQAAIEALERAFWVAQKVEREPSAEEREASAASINESWKP